MNFAALREKINRFHLAATRRLDAFLGTTEAREVQLPNLPVTQRLLEWGLLFLAITIYCADIINLDRTRILTGNETYVFQLIDFVVETSLKQTGVIPLWNPYILSGLPLVGDPMLHLYNPFFLVPFLLLGTINGFKIAIYLHFLLAGLGMWHLTRRLGLSGPARVFAALLFAFAGVPMAKFFQGHYLFVAGYAWVAWVFGLLLAAIQTRRRLYLGLTALALFIFFVTGNYYYQFYTLFVLAIFAPFYVLQVREKHLSVDWKAIIILAIVGVLALGLISIQLLPNQELHTRYGRNISDPAYSQSISQVFSYLSSTNTFRDDTIMPMEEFYAYLGMVPLLILPAIALVIFPSRKKRSIFFLLALLVFTLLWIDFLGKPYERLFVEIWPFIEFRYQLRMLVYTTLAVILLSSIVMDELWLIARRLAEHTKSAFRPVGQAFLAALVLICIYAVTDVFSNNRQYISSVQVDHSQKQAAAQWLKQQTGTVAYVGGIDHWYFPFIENDLRFYEAWYPVGDVRDQSDIINGRQVQAHSNYRFISSADAANLPEDSVLLQTFQDYAVIAFPNSLPFAFSTAKSSLEVTNTTEPVTVNEVTPMPVFTPNPNTIEVIAESKGAEVLTILSTNFPGWELEVDGRPANMLNVGGYLAAAMEPGTHRYVFSYRPITFYTGALITVIFLFLTLWIVFSDAPTLDWHAIRDQLRQPRWRNPLGDIKVQIPGLPEIFVPDSKNFITTRAVYRDGVLHPQNNISLKEGDSAQILAYAESSERRTPAALALWLKASANLLHWLAGFLPATTRLEAILFAVSLAVYCGAVFTNLEAFPPYFFSDEAHITEYAEELIRNNFVDANNMGIPIYVEAAGNRWTPLSVMYIHAISLLLIGKSIFATRATSAFIGLLAALALSYLLKRFYNAKYWWAAPLVMVVMPAWFIHTRTGFETAITTAIYGIFLLAYLLYRYQSPRFLYLALFIGAFGFYSYSNAQAIFGLLSILLLLSDLKYHVENRAILPRALVLAVALAMPLMIFRIREPGGISAHMRTVGSYLFSDMPVTEKIFQYAKEFFYGISPQYWFFPANRDIVRHAIPDTGHMPLWILPFLLLGAVLAILRIKDSRYRTLLLFALATSSGGAIAQVSITRVLVFVIPVTILTVIAISWLVEQAQRLRLPDLSSIGAIVLGMFLVISSTNLYNYSMTQWTSWGGDYGLYGWQYGAKQIFTQSIPKILASNPNATINLSTVWANSPENYIPFFMSAEEQDKVVMTGVDGYLLDVRPISPNDVFIFTRPEFDQVTSSGKLTVMKILDVINYPNGEPGFYVIQMEYNENAASLIAAEEEERRKPITEEIIVNGEVLQVTYARLNDGSIANVFDNDFYTLVRGEEANPFPFDITFAKPRRITGLVLDIASFDYEITVSLYSAGDEIPTVYSTQKIGVTQDPHIEMAFENPPIETARIVIEIRNLLLNGPANIHIRNISFLP